MNFKKKLLTFFKLIASLFMTYYLFELSLIMIFPNGVTNHTLVIALSMSASVLIAVAYKIKCVYKDKRTTEIKNGD